MKVRSNVRSVFEILNIQVLRDYLRREFKELPNGERAIDDFILMCILVGNDFLPRLRKVVDLTFSKFGNSRRSYRFFDINLQVFI